MENSKMKHIASAIVILFIVMIPLVGSPFVSWTGNENETSPKTIPAVYDEEENCCNMVGTNTRSDLAEEFVSATNLLAAYTDISISDVYDNFNFGNSSLEDFVGDSITGYAMPSAVTIALGNVISQKGLGSSYSAQNVTGTLWGQVLSRLNDGIPLMVWITSDMEDPTDVTRMDDGDTWYSNRKIVVIYKVEDSTVYAIDPVDGKTTYNESYFEGLYEMCGQKCVMIRHTVI